MEFDISTLFFIQPQAVLSLYQTSLMFQCTMNVFARVVIVVTVY